MNFSFKLISSLFLLLTIACREQHLFSDRSELETVIQDFETKQKELPRGNLFEVFSHPMTPEEKEAMMFLYAYMPIGDLTDYSGDFFLQNVK